MALPRWLQFALLLGLDYLINISYVENVEVFKTCLDYWNYFVPDVYASACTVDAGLGFTFAPSPVPPPPKRRQLYAGTLSKLRQLMICRMAKPEEVRKIQPSRCFLTCEPQPCFSPRL